MSQVETEVVRGPLGEEPAVVGTEEISVQTSLLCGVFVMQISQSLMFYKDLMCYYITMIS